MNDLLNELMKIGSVLVNDGNERDGVTVLPFSEARKVYTRGNGWFDDRLHQAIKGQYLSM